MMMATRNHRYMAQAPPGMKKGVYVPPEEEVVHPYLNRYRELSEDENEKFNMAASLQAVTEDLIFMIVQRVIEDAAQKGFSSKNI